MNEINDSLAADLQQLLKASGHRIAFAESCTAGLIAATLGRIPGISEWLAGSAVVYQVETKAAWLKVERDILKDPGPVSKVVSQQMATGVLGITEHATVAASVTGHLGPEAPPEQDGTAWSSIVLRRGGEVFVDSRLMKLDLRGDVHLKGMPLRHSRQIVAVRRVLEFCIETLSNHS